jgi:molybdopterin-guanine dinucleotide biosynthesis protein A
MINKNQITGVVLAGGKSQRMKTDKALVMYKNKTLLENQVNLLSSIFSKIVISANTNEYSFLNKKIVKDKINSKGPIGGVLSILKEINTDYIFVLSVDMPFVKKEFIEFLIRQIDDEDIVIPIHNANFEPTCAIYSKNCISNIESQIAKSENKLKNLFNICNTKFIDVSDNTLFDINKIFTNLNYQKDLDLLR